MAKSAAKNFTAILERENSGLGWTIIRIPFDAARAWKMGGRPKVRGEINGFEFRTTLFPDGNGGHTLLVNKKMQNGAGVVAGLSANFRLEPDLAERSVSIPTQLKIFLAENRALFTWYEKLNHSTRKYMTDLIVNVKNPEARARRAENVAELLLATMEGERELPPIFQAAFARDPRARRGWEMMTQLQRRGNLMAIFYYRNPQSRAKRLAKVMEQAIEIVEKNTKRGAVNKSNVI